MTIGGADLLGTTGEVVRNSAEQTAEEMRRHAEEVRRTFLDSQLTTAGMGRVAEAGLELSETSKEEVKKQEIFDRLQGIVGSVDSASRLDRQKRTKTRYGSDRMFSSAWFAGADIKGGASVGQETIRKGTKILWKNGVISGSLSLIFASIIGASSAPVIAGVIGGGMLGRGIVEGVRIARGKERNQRKEIEEANDAVMTEIQKLAMASMVKLSELAEAHAGEADYDPKNDPEWLDSALQVFDLLEDESKRNVEITTLVGENGKRKNQYYVLSEGEEAAEDSRVINISEEQDKLRKTEKRNESVSDLVSAACGFAGGIAMKVLAGARAATEASQRVVQHSITVKNALESGKAIGPENFDHDKASHIIRLARDAAGHLTEKVIYFKDHLTNGNVGADIYTRGDQLLEKGIQHWHSIGGNIHDVLASIRSSDLAALGAHKAQLALDQIKTLIVYGSGLLLPFAARVVSDVATNPDKKIEQNQKDAQENRAGIERLFSGDNSRASVSEPTRLAVPVPEGLDRSAHEIVVSRSDNEIEIGGEKIVILAGGRVEVIGKTTEGRFLFMILDKDGNRLNNRDYDLDQTGLDKIRAMLTAENGGAAGVATTSFDETVTKGSTKELGDDERAKILARLEEDKNLSEEKLTRLQKAASWVISRLSAEQIASLTLNKELLTEEERAEEKAISDKRFRELAKIVLKNEIVTHYTSVSPDGNKFYLDLDGKCCIGLCRLAGIEINTNDSAMYVPAGGSVPGKVMVDTSGHEGVGAEYDVNEGNFGTTGWADHHDPSSGRSSSGTLRIYEVLIGLGMIDEEAQPHLKKMVEFVTKVDNAAFAERKETYNNSYKTMVGLSRYLSYDNLDKFFKDGTDPEKELTNAELIKYGLKKEVKDRNGVVLVNQGFDKTVEHKEKIDISLAEMKITEEGGLIVDSCDPDKFGKIVVDVGNHIKLGYETTRYCGYDTYLLWNPITESFFISSKNAFPEGFKLDQGKQVRENIWIKSPNTVGESTLKLKDVLACMVGKNIQPTGELEKTFVEEDKWEKLAETGERPEDVAMAEDFWRRYRDRGGNVEGYKDKLKAIIINSVASGVIERGLDSINEINEIEKQRFSAVRLLAKEMGYKVGAFSVNMKERKAKARIEKIESDPADSPEPEDPPKEGINFDELENASIEEALKIVGFENIDPKNDEHISVLKEFKDALYKYGESKAGKSEKDKFDQAMENLIGLGIIYGGDGKISVLDLAKSLDILLKKMEKEPVANSDELENGEEFVDEFSLMINGVETKLAAGITRENISDSFSFKIKIEKISRSNDGKIGMLIDIIDTKSNSSLLNEKQFRSVEEWQEFFENTIESK